LAKDGHKPYIVIDDSKCKGCLLCVSACAKSIIGTARELSRTGYFPAIVIEEKAATCTGCLNCVLMCPDTAISVYARPALARVA
jgi:2-oxoglutarate ferredoxin oxidoreductase subunit delta